jgi:hypothetical protein
MLCGAYTATSGVKVGEPQTGFGDAQTAKLGVC